MKKTAIWSLVALLLSAAGLMLAAEMLVFDGDMWATVYVVVFGFELIETAWLWYAQKHEKHLPRWAGFVDMVLFIVGLGLSLFHGRFRMLGLNVMLVFPLRQMMRRQEEQTEDAEEKEERFQQHIKR